MINKRLLILAAAVSLAALALAACAPSSVPAAAPTTAPEATSMPAATSAAQAPTTAATTAATSAATSAPSGSATTSAPAQAPTTSSSSGSAMGAATVQMTQNSTLGNILTDANGRTLYVFSKDTSNTSNCTGACATLWPPLTTQGAPVAGSGVTGGMLGTTQRQDGSTQVTYNGHPLYMYSVDKAAGDTKGQGFNQLWYVVGPDGNPVKTGSSSAPAGAPTQSAPQATPY